MRAVQHDRQPPEADAGTNKGLVERVTAGQGTEPIAAANLYVHPQIHYRGVPVMLFGDLSLPAGRPLLCRTLIQEAEEAARRAGYGALLGPINGSTWQDYRLPLQGDKPMFTGDIASPASWATILQEAGFSPAETYRSCLADLRPAPEPALPRGIVLRTITPETLTADLPLIYALCLRAFAKSPFFTAISESDFSARYERLRPLLQAGLSKIAFCDTAPVAFLLAYPDAMIPDRKRVVIKSIARNPDMRIPGLITSLVDTLYHSAYALGYRQAIHALMHDRNRSVQRSQEFGGALLRRYAVLFKKLQDER